MSSPITRAPAVTTTQPQPVSSSAPVTSIQDALPTRGVRLVNVMIDQPRVRLCLQGEHTDITAGYAEASAHVAIRPGTSTASIALAGDPCHRPFANVHLPDRAGLSTIVATGSSHDGSARLTLLTDDFSAPATGFARARPFHADPEAGVVDLGRLLGTDTVVRLFTDLRYEHTAAASADPNFNPTTGYASLPAIGGTAVFGAFRQGTPQQLVEVKGPDFIAGRIFSIYVIGAVLTTVPPAALLVCDDTDANVSSPARCQTFPARVLQP